MTNPNDAVGTSGAYGGRTSVYAFNDSLAPYSRGILSGWVCTPSTGLTVTLGGDGSTRDVAVAEDNIGNRTTINNISLSPISVTISAAPSTNSRIDLIVAYVENAPIGVSTVTDNPSACGLIVVKGTAASTPVPPNDSAIRTAITGDGGSGTTAYYVVLAQITIASGTTTLTSSNITAGASSVISTNQYDRTVLGGDYSTSEVNTGFTWVDGKIIYKKSVYISSLPNTAGSKIIAHGISNLDAIINIEGCYMDVNGYIFPVNSPVSTINVDSFIRTIVFGNNIQINVGMDRSNCSGYVTLYYTKTS